MGGRRRAFTLVEMLVAVGLVVLMMSLFATIFEMSTGAMAKQKALAEGDQRVRLVLTLLRNDLSRRTMIEVTPFVNSDSATAIDDNADPLGQRMGYLYIGENDPDDGTDDNLQLTVQVASGEDRYYGAARSILPDAGGLWGITNPIVANPLAPPTGVAYWQNQPEFDDQMIGFPDGASSSSAAEVSWFLRNGTLYRRVMLIRQPSTPASASDPQTTNYPTAVPGPLSFATYETAIAARNFYTDFDFSGYIQGTFQFHGTPDLNPGGTLTPLGNPHFRFGFSLGTALVPTPCLPREFTSQYRDLAGVLQNTPADIRYIGRFTHEETSYNNPASLTFRAFGYPARIDANAPDPYNPLTLITFNQTTGKVEEYTGGSRIAEDVVMTNVHRFDIKVFDEGATFGPDGQPGRGFDPGPDGMPGVALVDDDGNGVVDDVGELGWAASDDTQVDDDGVAPPNDNLELGWPGTDDGDFFDIGHSGVRGYYRASALLNATYCPLDPRYPPALGKRFYRFDTWNPSVTMNDGFAAGPAFDLPPFRAPNASPTERRRLRAIQITITFFDTTSQSLRDVTFVQSLMQ